MRVSLEKIKHAVAQLSYEIDDNEADRLMKYLNSMFLWNRAYNLTAITDPDEMVVKHLLDSLVLKPYLEERCSQGRLVDVGSGAGLPGIPLSIVMPGHYFVLLDSNSKRTRFLTQMKMEMNLANIEVVHSRVQDYQPEELFDLVLSRAFASGEDMVQWSRHLLKQGGAFAAMKGKVDLAEWESVSGYEQMEIKSLDVPDLAEERHLIFLSK